MPECDICGVDIEGENHYLDDYDNTYCSKDCIADSAIKNFGLRYVK